jgi:hypothetical protein
VSEIIGRVNLPLIARAVVRGCEDAVRYEIPHLRIPIFEILLHSKDCFSRIISTILHFLEFGEGLVDWS